MARTNELTPDSIQEALRLFLQPIKSNNIQHDFYAMYKREMMEYDTEYIQKYNEDLDTTLIFVGFWLPFIAIQC
jgi:trans-2-enoyl-CoA reductase